MASGGNYSCRQPEHRSRWYAPDKFCNYSAFNGYKRTISEYSYVHCPLCPSRTAFWRTKAAYVVDLPNTDPGAAA